MLFFFVLTQCYSGNLADEALNAQAAFAAKAAERKKKIELESSKSNVNKDKIMEIYNSGKPLMEGELLKKTRTGGLSSLFSSIED